MKAYVLRANGKLNMEETERPVPGKDEVLVAVRAAGICGSDIARIYNSGAYFYPLVPGHEFSGEVEAVGDNVGSRWIGKRVGIFPLIPCGECEPCLQKKYQLCRNYSYLGSRRDGGFAEYVVVPEWNLIELPDNVTFEQAAMLEPMSVAIHAVRRADIKAGSTVAVCGLGTIGLMVVSFLMELDLHNILLLGKKRSQEEAVLRLGAADGDYCDTSVRNADDWIDEKTEGRGVDVFFDCTGKNDVVSLAVRHTASCGKVLLVGNPASDMAFTKQDYWKILRNELTVAGTWNSSFSHDEGDDWHYCLERISSGLLEPQKLVSHRYPFERLTDGLLIMRDKTEDYIKIMISS